MKTYGKDEARETTENERHAYRPKERNTTNNERNTYYQERTESEIREEGRHSQQTKHLNKEQHPSIQQTKNG